MGRRRARPGETGLVQQQQQISPYFNPTYTRTGWIGQPPVLDRHEAVTIGGDVVTLCCCAVFSAHKRT